MGVGTSLATRVFECKSYPERVRILETAMSEGAMAALLSMGSNSADGASSAPSALLPKLDEWADGDSSHVTLLERLATCFMFEKAHPSWPRIRPTVLAAVRRIRRPNARNRMGDALIHVMLQCAASIPAASAAADPELLEFFYDVTAALLELGVRRRSRPKPLAVATRLGWSRTPSPAVSQAPSSEEEDDSDDSSGSDSGPDSPPPEPPPPPRSHNGLSRGHGSRSCMHVPVPIDHSTHFLSIPNSAASSAVSTPRGGNGGGGGGGSGGSSRNSDRDRALRKRLRRAVDINAIGGRWGLAPLHWVCHIEHEAAAFHMLTLLLSRRGGGSSCGGVAPLDLSLRDSEGNTFLHQMVLRFDSHSFCNSASRLLQVFALLLPLGRGGGGDCPGARGKASGDWDWFAPDAQGRTFLQLEAEVHRAHVQRWGGEAVEGGGPRKQSAAVSPLHRAEDLSSSAACLAALPPLPSPLMSPSALPLPLPGTPPAMSRTRSIAGEGEEDGEAASAPPALPPSMPASPLGPVARSFFTNRAAELEAEPELLSKPELQPGALLVTELANIPAGADVAVATAVEAGTARAHTSAKLSILHECCVAFESEWRDTIRPMIQRDIRAHLPDEQVVAVTLAFIDGMA